MSPQSRYAIVSIITDNFIGLGATWLASLMEHYRGKSTDIILLTASTFAPLSSDNREVLRRICPSVQFHDIDDGHLNADNTTRYRNGKVVKASIDALVPSKRAAYLKLNVLKVFDYERVLWLDSDMLVVADFSEIFSLPGKLAVVAVGASTRRAAVEWKKRGGFNSGLMLIGKDYRTEAWFHRAIELLNARIDTSVLDQSVFNLLWAEEKKLFLPHAYNWKLKEKRLTDPGWQEAREMAKIIHLVGPIKWRLKEQEDAASDIYRIFHDTRERHGIAFVLEP